MKNISELELSYQRLFETVREGNLLLETETGTIIDDHKFLVDMLHHSREELVAKKLWEDMFSRHKELIKESFDKLQRVGYIHYEDVPSETKADGAIDVDSAGNGYPVGRINVSPGSIPESTERKKAEHQQHLALAILKLLNRPGKTNNLIQSLLQTIQKYTGIEAVGIRLREGEDYPYFSTGGFLPRFVELEKYLCNRGPDGEIVLDAQGHPGLACMCGTVIMKRTDPALPFFTEYGSFWTNGTSELLSSTTEKDRQATTRNRCNREGYESVALIPLYADGEIVGLLQLNDKRTDCFTRDLVRFFEGIGDSIGIAFEQRRRDNRTRKALETAVQIVAAMVEKKDTYTADHQRRVADLARAIATEMGLSADRIDGLGMASTIHDMGKISVPVEILCKPTELTGLEFSLIKGHVQTGYDILKDLEFPWPIARMVLEHHERINGSGYPQGLTAGQTLMESRILAIADVVESMASHRPYRPARGIDAALEEINSNKGILYDSQAVDAFLTLFKDKRYSF